MNFKVATMQQIEFPKAKFREGKAISERSQPQLLLLALHLGPAFSVFLFSDKTHCPSLHLAPLRIVRSCVLAKTVRVGCSNRAGLKSPFPVWRAC